MNRQQKGKVMDKQDFIDAVFRSLEGKEFRTYKLQSFRPGEFESYVRAEIESAMSRDPAEWTQDKVSEVSLAVLESLESEYLQEGDEREDEASRNGDDDPNPDDDNGPSL